MIVAVNSDGLINIIPSPPSLCGSSKYPFGLEKSRSILTGGIVTRTLDSEYIYSRDIMLPDGSRIILRNLEDIEKRNKKQKVVKKTVSRSASTPNKKTPNTNTIEPTIEKEVKETKELFVSALVRDAPDEWSYLHLDVNGSVTFYSSNNSINDNNNNNNEKTSKILPFDKIKNIKKSYIDAETKSEIFEYRDGRIIINWANEDIRETRFPDGTRIVTHLLKNTVYIEKINSQYPTVEIDVNIDKICRKHSRGEQVPIALGGERIRSRISMSDGTAILIKYNTKVTAQYNGSLKVVRRNRESMLIEDGGIVTYFPPTSWSQENEKEFIRECATDTKPRFTPYQTKENNLTKGINSAISGGGGNGGIVSTKVNKSTENRSTNLSQKKTSDNRGSISSQSQSQSSFSNKKPLPPTRVKSGDSVNVSNTNTNNNISRLTPETPADIVNLKTDTHIDNTKYVFHLSKLSCHVEDHENNVFDLDYFNPYEPKVFLAGEVDGLKPKAITEKTIEAKVYIINRNGNAIQVVGNQEMNDLEVSMKMAPDSMKYITEAKFPPCDLGGAKLHTYFKRRFCL